MSSKDFAEIFVKGCCSEPKSIQRILNLKEGLLQRHRLGTSRKRFSGNQWRLVVGPLAQFPRGLRAFVSASEASPCPPHTGSLIPHNRPKRRSPFHVPTIFQLVRRSSLTQGLLGPAESRGDLWPMAGRGGGGCPLCSQHRLVL